MAIYRVQPYDNYRKCWTDSTIEFTDFGEALKVGEEYAVRGFRVNIVEVLAVMELDVKIETPPGAILSTVPVEELDK
jgi:hypothetical protein